MGKSNFPSPNPFSKNTHAGANVTPCNSILLIFICRSGFVFFCFFYFQRKLTFELKLERIVDWYISCTEMMKGVFQFVFFFVKEFSSILYPEGKRFDNWLKIVLKKVVNKNHKYLNAVTTMTCYWNSGVCSGSSYVQLSFIWDFGSVSSVLPSSPY